MTLNLGTDLGAELHATLCAREKLHMRVHELVPVRTRVNLGYAEQRLFESLWDIQHVVDEEVSGYGKIG